MKSTRFSTVTITAMAALFLAGCTASEEGPSTAKTPKAAELPPPALRAYYSQKLSWKDCGGGFQCSMLEVPLDYAKPDGGRIKIAVNRLPASDTRNRIGSVLLNPGGPGGSGLEYARQATNAVSVTVRTRFDVVGFDPRGVGESTPVRCLDPQKSKQDLELLVGTSHSSDDTRYERLFARKCARKSGRLLPHVGTANAARDMDVLRAALGDERLTYLGKSYGSELGATYASLFPRRVRALVLDGALDPSADPVAEEVNRAKGREIALRAFATDCLKSPDCPLRARTTTKAVKEIARLWERAERKPLTSTTDRKHKVTGAWVAAGTTFALYQKQAWPILRKALTQAIKRNDGTLFQEIVYPFLGRSPDGTWSNTTDAAAAIVCVDHPRIDRKAAAEAARKARKEAPTFAEGLEHAWQSCRFWPVPAPKARKPLRANGSAPILVIGTKRDPSTPFESSMALARQLGNARVLSYDGDGHTAYMSGSACVDGAVDRYLTEQRLPAANAQCPGA